MLVLFSLPLEEQPNFMGHSISDQHLIVLSQPFDHRVYMMLIGTGSVVFVFGISQTTLKLHTIFCSPKINRSLGRLAVSLHYFAWRCSKQLSSSSGIFGFSLYVGVSDVVPCCLLWVLPKTNCLETWIVVMFGFVASVLGVADLYLLFCTLSTLFSHAF